MTQRTQREVDRRLAAYEDGLLSSIEQTVEERIMDRRSRIAGLTAEVANESALLRDDYRGLEALREQREEMTL